MAWHGTAQHSRVGHCTEATCIYHPVSCPLGRCSTRLNVSMPVPMPVPGKRDGGPRQRDPPLTCPAAAVLLAHVGAMLQQHPGALEVAQRGGQVQRGASSGVQLLDVGLPGGSRAQGALGWLDLTPPMPSCRREAPGWSSQGKQPTFAGISESIPIPELPQEMHMHCTPKGSPCSPQPLPAPWGRWGECNGGCQHPAQLGTVRLGCTHHSGTEQGHGAAVGGMDAPGAVHGALHGLMQLQALEKPPPLGFGRGGCCPVARQELPAAPLHRGQEHGGRRGLRRAHVFPCLSRGRAAV